MNFPPMRIEPVSKFRITYPPEVIKLYVRELKLRKASQQQ